MRAKLYVIRGSHACRAGMLLLDHKGIDYDLVQLPVGLHPLLVRLRGFEANPDEFRRLEEGSDRTLGPIDRLGTVPSLELDGRRVKQNRAIARFLDEVRPDPPLFPADPDRRGRVEEAERWGDEVLQMDARRLVLVAGARGDLVDGADRGRLGPLLWRRRPVRRIGTKVVARAFRAGPGAERRLLDKLPRLLDRVDGWIEAGVLNGEQINAADCMIAPSLALLCYREDARAAVESRPARELIDRLLPAPA